MHHYPTPLTEPAPPDLPIEDDEELQRILNDPSNNIDPFNGNDPLKDFDPAAFLSAYPDEFDLPCTSFKAQVRYFPCTSFKAQVSYFPCTSFKAQVSYFPCTSFKVRLVISLVPPSR